MEAERIPEPVIQHLTAIFKLLSDRSRLKIVLTLAQVGEMHVTALCAMLGNQSQPAVSHHLTLMRAAGLVCVDRRGKHNFYALASEHIRELVERVFGTTTGGQRQLVFQDWTLSIQQKDE